MRDVFRAVVRTVIPEASRLDEAGWRELEELVEDALGRRSPGIRRQLRVFLRLLQWIPLLRHGRRFTALDASRRTLFLSRLQGHPLDRIRLGFWGLRTLALLGYYGRDAAREELGYRPDPSGWGAPK